MTFFDISRKMLKAGFYKYRLYFLCNLSATALFCCFAVISTNRTFMNASIVNSSISNNIYLPFFLSAVFLFFFLLMPSQSSFCGVLLLCNANVSYFSIIVNRIFFVFFTVFAKTLNFHHVFCSQRKDRTAKGKLNPFYTDNHEQGGFFR